MNNNLIIALIILTGIAIFTGCGKDDTRPKDLPPLFPCEITIIQDGNPLSGATARFVPMNAANAKYQAAAITDDTGKAVASTYGFDGVPAGKYKICVVKTVVEGVTKVTDSYGDLVDSPGTEYRTVDPQYSNEKTTPHEIEIAGGKQKTQASFDVGKPVKIKKS